MAKFLIDTDVIIWFLRGKKETVELIEKLQKFNILTCSPISIVEVQAGAKKSEEEITSEFLNSLEIILMDRVVANKAGELLREYKRKGITLGINDTIVGTACLVYDLVLVTYNLRHYPFKELRFYQF